VNKRSIIKINEGKCDGCGQCIPGCPEGALQIVDGKARLVTESFCDGLGACLGHCPQGALHVEERDAEDYDAQAVLDHLEEQSPELAQKHREHLHAHGLAQPGGVQSRPAESCPSKQVYSSTLTNWPVKLYLIPPAAEFLKNADLLLVADCVPFAYANMHKDFFAGRTVAVGCPKFDDPEAYEEKICNILESVNINSITILYMEITCCQGFISIVNKAVKKSETNIPLETVLISIEGEVMEREVICH